MAGPRAPKGWGEGDKACGWWCLIAENQSQAVGFGIDIE